jgi:subtilisin family serine protease
VHDRLHALSARAVALLAALACLVAIAAPAAATPGEDPADRRPASTEPTPDAGDDPGEVVPGSLIVTHAPQTEPSRLLPELPAAARAAAGRAAAVRLGDGITQVTVPPAAAEAAREALLAAPGVVAVEPDRILSFASTGTTRTPDDPRYPEQWAHRPVEGADAPGGWLLSTGSPSLRIAIVDSGIDASHPDLAGVVTEQWHVDSRVNPGPGGLCRGPVSPNADLAYDHGTFVAGVAAARGDNGVGITGVTWRASVLDYQISTTGDCFPSDGKVIRALTHLVDRTDVRADVVNLSLGGPQTSGVCPTGLQAAIDAVRARGTVVVAAAGNDGDYTFQAPAGCRGVIAVAALTRSGQRAGYSSMGAYLDLAAPGDDVLTTTRDGGYQTIGGTSFSAPYVAGTVALMQQVRVDSGQRRLTPDEVEGTLEATATHPLGAGQHDERLGWGRLSVRAAVAAARNGPITQPRAARVSASSGTTEPISQAVAVSRRTFTAGEAEWAVIGRADDYADALAGSSLAYGVGPLLFAPRTGGLPGTVRSELQRVLPRSGCSTQRGGPCVVYLLGGSAALDLGLEAEVRALGFEPRRLRGDTREATAVVIAEELRHALARFDQQPVGPHREFILATRGNWPDAVAAGSLGSVFGIPILLTEPGRLHPATAAYLASGSMDAVGGYVVGGNAAISDETLQRATAAATPQEQPRRLGGAARDGTAIRVSAEVERRLAQWDIRPSHAVAVDLDRSDAYAHALSASVVTGRTFSVFVPVRGPAIGQRLTAETLEYACDLAAEPLLAGDIDLLPDALGRELRAVLRDESPRCG